ncbi:MAG TPA: phosphocholine cytidylyltransferase family protein [Thermohalobaculum sp.]|nr:phosphocholine cytidylyltransferase family protein [Thermohalobaculum sp.]
MTNAVILSAGQGRRLSPLTDARPKCLVPIAGRPILEWQMRALAEAGVEEISVVTGFCADAVEAFLKTTSVPVEVSTVFNPFYSVADNIGSCWAAKELIGEDTLLLNGDTLFEPAVAEHVMRAAEAPISVTVDRKRAYDSDDMKIRCEDGRLTAIGKTLSEPVDGESIGMIRFSGQGGARFVAAMRAALGDPAMLERWYLSIVDGLARQGGVGVVSIEGMSWSEIDFLRDLPIAESKVARFLGSSADTGVLSGAM